MNDATKQKQTAAERTQPYAAERLKEHRERGTPLKLNAVQTGMWALKWMWSVHRFRIIACFMIVVMQAVSGYFTPGATKRVFDEDIDSGTMRQLLYALGVVAFLAFLEEELMYQLLKQTPANGDFVPGTQAALVAHVSALPFSKVELMDHSRLMVLIQQEVSNLNDALTSVVEFISYLTTFVVYIGEGREEGGRAMTSRLTSSWTHPRPRA